MLFVLPPSNSKLSIYDWMCWGCIQYLSIQSVVEWRTDIGGIADDYPVLHTLQPEKSGVPSSERISYRSYSDEYADF